MFKCARTGALLCVGIGLALTALGQSTLTVYTDSLQNGFQDWSWATRNLNNASPVHSGSRSISVTATAWQGLSFWHSDLDTAPYTSFSFWAHGGTAGGQRLVVYAEYGTNQGPSYALPSPLPANSWQQYTVSLASLGVGNTPNFNRITLQLSSQGTSGTFYVDDVQFNPNPVPSLVNVNLDTAQVLQVAEERHFAVNLAVWDYHYDPPEDTNTTALLREMGSTAARMPGGSLSDDYHFASNKTGTNTWQWGTSFPDFMRVCTNANLSAMVTVNYGSGSPEEAAAWVAYANASASIYGTAADVPIGVDAGGQDWKTAGYWARLRSWNAAQNPDNSLDFLALGRAAPLGIKYWEIGNECYGTWERDTNALPHHAYTYATRAAEYLARMRAVDAGIQIGVVGAPGESAYSNGYTDHPARNPRTGQTNYGWTPVMLSTLRDRGAAPDFLVHHVYPQWTDGANPANSPDNDATLLQSTGNWALDAADLRQQLTDYLGPAGTHVQLVCTENNSDSGAQGRQSTSLVNGLYYADSLARLLRTEFKGFVWWDLRNGTDTNGYFGARVYGWRTYGDLGMVNGASTRHPTFYAAKLMQSFARPGDKILNATSDYPMLAAHAARRVNGSVAVFLVNKSLSVDLNARITLQGFVPAQVAAVGSYGIPNDEAARTNAPLAAQDISTGSISSAAASFTTLFPKLSLTVITLTPPPPAIRVVSAATGGQIVLKLEGQADVPYVVQSSGNLASWVSISTNRLTGSSLLLTNSTAGSAQNFWRAAWIP